MVDFTSMPLQKQLVSSGMNLPSDTLGVLVHTLQVCPDTTKMVVEEVLGTLKHHFQEHNSTALWKRAFSICKQSKGESFNNFY